MSQEFLLVGLTWLFVPGDLTGGYGEEAMENGNQQQTPQAMVLATLAEHSLPFAPVMVKLAQALASDKVALSGLKLSRTSAAYKMVHGLGFTFSQRIFSNLRKYPFSINLDESTTNGNKKVLSILVSFFNGERETVDVEHLGSLEVMKVTSFKLEKLLVSFFSDNDIPWSNLVSMLMDSCVNAEFMRITTMPLQTKFMAQLDRYSADLTKLFSKRGGAAGKKSRHIMERMAQVWQREPHSLCVSAPGSGEAIMVRGARTASTTFADALGSPPPVRRFIAASSLPPPTVQVEYLECPTDRRLLAGLAERCHSIWATAVALLSVHKRDGDEGDGGGVVADLLDVDAHFLFDFLVTGFAVRGLGGVHLVDSDDELLHAEGVGQQRVLAGLAVLGDAGLELTNTASNDQHGAVSLK
ncbi:hypothetical protein EYF80_051751 [Liparis tanakae]|uniref:DUF4371 domain-containing protein n=1 Tax=Liparis tanakae TaxID=230148 RepID=A0A4Z2FBE0_9TELE|nr:hypothetical protein EYF80_051751 [Liparis tanakae]